ncbi:helicase associated domain-containing protein [Streptomyces taklimakanensis]|uniref:helicase associated domain-containing protein n=1 Tax=Streptomyces taklimakanensis TaxID=2569853 RepID=UPI003B75BEED
MAGGVAGGSRDGVVGARRGLRGEPRRGAGLLRGARDAVRATAGGDGRRPADRSVTDQLPPPRRARQRPATRGGAGRPARCHRSELEPGGEGLDRRLATAVRQSARLHRRQRHPRRDPPRRHCRRRGRRTLARPTAHRVEAAGRRTTRTPDRPGHPVHHTGPGRSGRTGRSSGVVPAGAGTWDRGLAALRQHQTREGHVRVPREWIETVRDETGHQHPIRLGIWISNQRQRQPRLPHQRTKALKELGAL